MLSCVSGFITRNHFHSAKQMNFLCSRLFVALLPTDIAKIVQTSKTQILFESFATSVAYFRLGKYIHFFTINALLEYYFFNYKEIAFLTGGKNRRANALYSLTHKTLSSIS